MADLNEIDVGQMVNKFLNRQVGDHVSMGGGLRFVLWLFIVGFVALLDRGNCLIHFGFDNPHTWVFLVICGISNLLVAGIRISAQWERGIVLRLGSFRDVRGPGVFYVIPVLDNVRFVDTRLQTHTIPKQKVITRDNVPTLLDGVLYYLIADPEKAILKVQDYKFAISQYAQGSLRDVVGAVNLDDLLAEREKIQAKIRDIIDAHVMEWGLHLDSIRLLDIELPEDLKRMMSRQASAEREKRATITKAEGDKLAAVNLSEAARLMAENPGAMQLRTLQTIDGLGPSSSNTVVCFPVEFAQNFKDLGGVPRILQRLTGKTETPAQENVQTPASKS
ncbi:MAG: SPFH domain-containing protein [Candidatus Riflebacteria bacterium]|nr:SPFH domain-containing protein [Candidatus Riflebacteria bacterium]